VRNRFLRSPDSNCRLGVRRKEEQELPFPEFERYVDESAWHLCPTEYGTLEVTRLHEVFRSMSSDLLVAAPPVMLLHL
jgi:hypothetical protein